MIALAIAAALIVQTFDGQTKIVSGLSPEGCDAARCMARFGKSCIAAAVDGIHEVAAAKARKAYEAAHPLICPASHEGVAVVCHRQGEPEFATAAIFGASRAVPSDATASAICVR